MPNRTNIAVTHKEIEEQKYYINELKNRVYGKGLKYHIVTYGCQMNVHDSEKLAGMLTEIGYEEANSQQEADLVLFNTCCVRENAEMRVYGNVGALKAFKQANPNRIIGVCGCMMQQAEVANYIKKTFPFVDLIFGTHNLHRFPILLLQALDSNQTVIEILDSDGKVVEHVPVKRAEGISAWVTVMYGCNNFCSYCIVPYVRGRERSRHPDDILGEIRSLALDGYKEVTLLGQNVNSYGKDLESRILFHQLLRKVNEVEGIERIRFTTSHPKDLSDELIMTMAECDKVCKHIHLPIQAGSNRILKKMNRKYTRESYIELVDKLRRHIPDIALSTDIIVGFPGETEEDFLQTMDIVEEIRYDSAFTFVYSPRRGTAAAKMKDEIGLEEKKHRLARLNELVAKISKEKNQEYLDRNVDVLVEDISKTNKEYLTGRTDTNKIVHFRGSYDLIGKFVTVKITEARAWSLEGKVLDDQGSCS